ncbi:hypothetical protein FRB91_007646, partial [Serendipita sp. 411]
NTKTTPSTKASIQNRNNRQSQCPCPRRQPPKKRLKRLHPQASLKSSSSSNSNSKTSRNSPKRSLLLSPRKVTALRKQSQKHLQKGPERTQSHRSSRKN